MSDLKRDATHLLIDFLDRAFADHDEAKFKRIWVLLTAIDYAKNRKMYERAEHV
jgi:hypothetical protein